MNIVVSAFVVHLFLNIASSMILYLITFVDQVNPKGVSVIYDDFQALPDLAGLVDVLPIKAESILSLKNSTFFGDNLMVDSLIMVVSDDPDQIANVMLQFPARQYFQNVWVIFMENATLATEDIVESYYTKTEEASQSLGINALIFFLDSESQEVVQLLGQGFSKPTLKVCNLFNWMF